MTSIIKPVARLAAFLLFLVCTVATVPQATADPYPQPIVTTTTLALKAKTIFGRSLTATATVKSDAGTPTGSVKFMFDGKGIKKVALANGVAKWKTPRFAKVGTHKVRAIYIPTTDSSFNTSKSAVKSYRIAKAPTRTRVSAPDISKGSRPSAAISVRTTSGLPGYGTVLVALKKAGATLQTKTVTLRRGKAVAKFTKVLRRAGLYSITAVFKGNGKTLASRGADSFAVS